MDPSTFRARISELSADQLEELKTLLSSTGVVWWPHLENRPQRAAYESKAFEVLYGGAAGGGKSDLILGTARNKHKRSLILRREFPDLERSLIARSFEFFGDRKFYNGSNHVWKIPVPDDRSECYVEFGHMERVGSPSVPGDESQYASAPYDLVAFDQLEQFPLFAYEFMLSRARSVDPRVPIQLLSSANWVGENILWIIDRWAPWLQKGHKHPAKPGEIRWFYRLTGDQHEREAPDGTRIWDEKAKEFVYPISRTFFPAKLADNPFLSADSAYLSRLQALPEPFRSALKDGLIDSMLEDDALQVIPRAWIVAAMNRWTSTPPNPDDPAKVLGVDVARGGDDQFVMAPRIGMWLDHLQKYPGRLVPDGPTGVSLLTSYAQIGYLAMIDVIGVGASVYDGTRKAGFRCVAVNFAESSNAMDRSKTLKFTNQRAEHYWLFRDLLDPANEMNVMLPPDPELEADLCAPRWKMLTNGIAIESKDQIRERLGRSPDSGDAVVLAFSRKAGGATVEQIKAWAEKDVTFADLPQEFQSWVSGPKNESGPKRLYS